MRPMQSTRARPRTPCFPRTVEALFAQHSIARTPPKSSEWLGKSHAIQIEWLAAFGGRLFDEGSQFGPRRRLVDDLLPAIIIHLRELAQLVEYGPSLCVAELWQFLNDLGCAHGALIIIWSRRFVVPEIALLLATTL